MKNVKVLIIKNIVFHYFSYLQGSSSRGVEDEEFLEQIFAVGRHVERDPVLSAQNSFAKLAEGRPVEGERAAD